MSKLVRFGIVGCGVIAATHADAIKELVAADLVACCDIIPERASCFADRHGISKEHAHSSVKSLLADGSVDAVSICTPSGTHAVIASEALWSGRPVIIEKPMDVNLEAVALVNAAQKETGLPLAVISQHRFDAASIYARSLAADGHLGALVICEAQIKWHRSQEYYDSGDWRGTWELDGGGALMNQGIHTVDLMRWIMGPVHSVSAVSRTLGHERIEVEDAICATISFENGAIGNLVASTAAYPGYPAQLAIHGSAGSVIISGDALASVDLSNPVPSGKELELLLAEGMAGHAVQVAQGGTRSAESNKAASADPTRSTWGDAHRAQIADFIDCIHSGRTPLVDGKAGKEAVEIILAAYESSRSGKAVNLS